MTNEKMSKLVALALDTAGTEEGDTAARVVMAEVKGVGVTDEFGDVVRIGKDHLWIEGRRWNVLAIRLGLGLIVPSLKAAIGYVGSQMRVGVVEFNGSCMAVDGNSDGQALFEMHLAMRDARHQRYINSQEYKDRCVESDRKAAAKAVAFADVLAMSPEVADMSRDPAGWTKHLENNNDPYGPAVGEYASLWARLMEGRVSAGSSVSECAEAMGSLADTDGITGFMYGCAVSILSQAWVYGDELKAWHNGKYGVSSESKGVINPALLTVSV